MSHLSKLRRTLGCLTLMLALLLGVGWERSNHRKDVISLPGDGDWHASLLSLENSMVLQTFESKLPVGTGLPMWTSVRQSVRADGSELNQPGIHWEWRWHGFGRATGAPGFSIYVAPYWSIVVPLALISLWFLGSPPPWKSSR